ncbi:MAG TPA: DMT family transporter [Bdellovibrio sp.]|uniref:DMT family transporter n=1 Tax=Bdellovibrio sp. TaxID=28201 RepID=UPI002EF66CD2
MQVSSHRSDAPKASLLKGVLFILIGSSSYGMLSTFVKLSYKQGYTTAEVTGAQFVIGAFVVSLLALFLPKNAAKATFSDKWKLMVTGTTTGLTSVLYYVSVKYIAASIAVVLLMQSVWLGVVFESLFKKTWPTLDKVIAVVLVLVGTVLATNALDTASTQLDIRGFIFGILAAISFSGTMMSTGSVASHLPSVKRSQFMLFGGGLVVLVFAFMTQLGPRYFGIEILSSDFIQNKPFEFSIFWTYGLFVAVFGTILPPIMLNKGFPITGVALGSIISSMELPFATLIAFALLGEHIGRVQLLGVGLILFSVFLLNYRMILKEKLKLAVEK